jgi:hypothetical protein
MGRGTARAVTPEQRYRQEEAMAVVTGTKYNDVMTPTVGRFTRPDGTVVTRSGR